MPSERSGLWRCDEKGLPKLPVRLLEQRKQQPAVFLIKVACGLVRQDQRRLVEKRAGKGNALALPARQL